MKKEIINKLNEGLENIFNTTNKNYINCLGEPVDLKLHDIAMLDEYTPELFNMFCEISYNDYCEFKKDLYIKEEYIGRSSSFYIVIENLMTFFDADKYRNMAIKEKVISLIDLFINTQLSYEWNLNELVEIKNNKIVDVNSNIIQFIKEFYYDIEYKGGFIGAFTIDFENFINDYLEDVYNTYKYIYDFKENQEEYYCNFLNLE